MFPLTQYPVGRKSVHAAVFRSARRATKDTLSNPSISQRPHVRRVTKILLRFLAQSGNLPRENVLTSRLWSYHHGVRRVLSVVGTGRLETCSHLGSAQLIIWRSANLGNRLSLNLWVDGKPIAPVSQGQTYRGSLSAGTHVVSALLVPNLLYLPPTKINLTAIPGKTYAYTAI